MATVGAFGSSVIFKVSDEQVLTFNNMSRTVKSKWAEHPGIGVKPVAEFIAPELDTVSMTIQLMASLGVDVYTIINRMERMCRNGETRKLVIGNQRVGRGEYCIESISETWDTILSNGVLYQATLNVTFKEV